MSASTLVKRYIYAYGLDASTGEYLVPRLTPEEIVPFAEARHMEDVSDLGVKTALETRAKGPAWVLRDPDEDPSNLGYAGWGVIFASDVTPNVKEALKPLLDLRKEQAGDRYVEYPCQQCRERCLLVESGSEFLRRHHVSRGDADPEEMPYYILIVGSPEKIPFAFQYRVDIERAVGRIDFQTPDEYARYAKSVVSAEDRIAQERQRAVLFSVQNDNDFPTKLSHEVLMRRLYSRLGTKEAKIPDEWELILKSGTEASKAQLSEYLNGISTPSLLVTTSHGASFSQSDPRQRARQGALVCREWPGRPQDEPSPLREEHYFSADDIESEANVHGLIAVCFACYAAGTPERNDFIHRRILPGEKYQRDIVTSAPFVSSLASKLLSRGALAFIGHVDRAWATSFADACDPEHPEQAIADIGAFEDLVKRLLKGRRVGWAMEPWSSRRATFDFEFGEKSKRVRAVGLALIENEMADLAKAWTASSDARNFVIIGDPAVRLSRQV